MNELVRLLVELSEDPFRREEFLNDPEAVLGTTGLSPEERAILLTRDPQKILEHLGHPKGSFLCILCLCIFLQLPGPPKKAHHGEHPDADKEGSSL
jgi:hypothetical protein